MTLKRFLVVFAFSFSVLGLNAQSKFENTEQELNLRFESLRGASNDSLKLSISQNVMFDLKRILLKKGSFTYPFNKLDNLGKVTSPDQQLRIFSWNYILKDGGYRYFALLLRKAGRKVELFELHQNLSVKESMTSKLSANQWLGALYYQIVPFTQKGNKLYLLLGWDGNNHRTSKKVIETLGFSKTGDLELGLPVINWRGKRLSRVIFEYSKQVQMKLKFHEKGNYIVFDHLSPSESRYVNQFEYYGPDFSYDALKLEKGIWNLVEEFDLNNLD
ncbi:MAG: hypothetical protein ACI93S_000234 [Ancylomarina sp.]|jgi:hypothetical protein